jgi:hypothetical protein
MDGAILVFEGDRMYARRPNHGQDRNGLRISCLALSYVSARPGDFRSRLGSGRECVVGRIRGVGYVEDGMDVSTVPSVTVGIFDILLSSTKTLFGRRFLDIYLTSDEEWSERG